MKTTRSFDIISKFKRGRTFEKTTYRQSPDIANQYACLFQLDKPNPDCRSNGNLYFCTLAKPYRDCLGYAPTNRYSLAH